MTSENNRATQLSALNERELHRYARHLTLPGFGGDAQRALRAARVLIIGAGGLGSPSLLYLAAAGVGHVTVIDDDVVDESNLQRQVIHREADIGRPKAQSARDALMRLDAHASVTALVDRLSPENARALFASHDLVLDGADNFATRYLSSDAAELTGTPLVWATISQFSGQLSVFWPGRGPMLRDLFPEIPDPDSVPSCAAGGVLGALVGQVGSMMAIEAIKVLTGVGTPATGRLVLIDAFAGTTRELRFAPDPVRPPVTTLAEAAAACRTAPTEDGPGQGTPAEAELTAFETHRLLSAEPDTTVLIDVRETEEHAESTIPGAVSVPLSRLEAEGWAALQGVGAGASGDSVKNLILHCRSGVRSARAVQILRDQQPPQPHGKTGGLAPAHIDPEHNCPEHKYPEHIYTMAGGILAWQAGPGAVARTES